MADNTTLKPCPNLDCPPNESAPYTHYDKLNGYYVVCDYCSMNGPHSSTESLAASAWNQLPRSTPNGLRPCEWRNPNMPFQDQINDWQSGFFHKITGGSVSAPKCVVESMEGTLREVDFNDFRFTALDRAHSEGERDG